ncbi:MAG: Patatin [Actinobacteria bacterium HGW-Actinobacteria-6]|jgi:NTE family protein|nr:MAG: Patatin [Actinobacteria bacterium HGW-Actinobacteria-6]
MWFSAPKTLGYALGSGAARGIAHVGVLKALLAEGLAPDVVTGTSMGAVVGAMYAAGLSPDEIERIAAGFDMKSIFSLVDMTIRGGALLSGEKVEEFLAAHLPATFEELRIPFACVSTDLARGERNVHTSGDLIHAVRASLSIPMVFMPIRDGKRILVDGFLTDPIPVSLARRLGAKVVVAVDVSGAGRLQASDGGGDDGGLLKDLRSALKGEGPRARGTSGLEVAAATFEVLERQVAQPALAEADFVVSPKVHDFAGYQFLAVDQLVQLGEQAGIASAARIRKLAHR